MWYVLYIAIIHSVVSGGGGGGDRDILLGSVLQRCKSAPSVFIWGCIGNALTDFPYVCRLENARIKRLLPNTPTTECTRGWCRRGWNRRKRWVEAGSGVFMGWVRWGFHHHHHHPREFIIFLYIILWLFWYT